MQINRSLSLSLSLSLSVCVCVVSGIWGTLLELALQFVQKHCSHSLVKEQDPICAWMNEIAQHQSAGD